MRNLRKYEPPQMGWMPEPGFFRFTEAISGEDWRILVKWEEWFLSRNIRTMRKSLFRNGMEWFALYREDFKVEKRPDGFLRRDKCLEGMGVP